MKKIFFLLLLLMPVLAYAQPSIQFESEKHDFGEVQQGAHLEHVFEFQNSGSTDLLISQLVPS